VSAFIDGTLLEMLIETSHCNIDLKPSPIEPSWIIEGNPEARSHMLWISTDRAAKTFIWSCSRGKFNWHYDFDETVLILEGSIVLESDTMPAKRYAAGDVIFFKDGAHARWHIEDRVRKLAFCRKTQPVWLGFALRVFLKLKKMLLPSGTRQPASLMGSS
jgi:uncharacterized protein